MAAVRRAPREHGLVAMARDQLIEA